MKNCFIKHCNLPVIGRGMCPKHYTRFMKYGDPFFIKIKPRGSGNIYNGYKFIIINGKKFREHRIIMEKYLGRKLSKKEHIHHKNNVRNDNRIENLEILTNSQHAKLHYYQYTHPRIKYSILQLLKASVA